MTFERFWGYRSDKPTGFASSFYEMSMIQESMLCIMIISNLLLTFCRHPNLTEALGYQNHSLKRLSHILSKTEKNCFRLF
jgi:hypothetical protein